MCSRFSSVRPVDGQLMDFGWPSRVKKPEEEHSVGLRQKQSLEVLEEAWRQASS